ncbi:MAG: preprotein translocase subunit SecD [Methanoculleaceae archaeon]
MTGKESILRDWHVILMALLVGGSIAAIYLIPPNPSPTGNIRFGLDLEGGSWLQLEYRAVVVGFDETGTLEEVIPLLEDAFDVDVVAAGPQAVEIRKVIPREEVESVLEGAGIRLTSYQRGVSSGTADLIKRILEDKVNTFGMLDARINTVTPVGSDYPVYTRVEIAGTDMKTAQDLVGTQGKFEIRIQTTGNESVHVLFGDAISSVEGTVRQRNGQWGVGFSLTEDGAEALRQAAIQYGAAADPMNHELIMLLDGDVVYSAPLSTDLAQRIKTIAVRDLLASTGSGDSGLQAARALEVHLRAGALPVEVSIAGSGSVPTSMGTHYRTISALAGVTALLAVAAVVYGRYRVPSIVLPMVGTNIAEVIILLGIARFIQQLDLAAIAGIIAVLGTGIDQLVVITDEVLYEGRPPSPGLYLKRLDRAFGIILVAALTTVIAMLPLALMDLSSLRGFAIVTIIGVLVGVLVTRPAYGRIIMGILSR